MTDGARRSVEETVDWFKSHVRGLARGYEFDVAGLWLKDGSVRPLPNESALIGKVLETSINEYLRKRFIEVRDLEWLAAKSTRTYPDLTFTGPAVDHRTLALDVKCARRNRTNPARTASAIAIGTYDAEYFQFPHHPATHIMKPYADYSAHLALIVLYDYSNATAINIEPVVVEKWRVATRKTASGTRCYIAASSVIDDLREERGAFASETEFESFWRQQPIQSATKLARYEKLRRERG